MITIKNTKTAFDQLTFSQERTEYVVEGEKHMRVVTAKTRITLYARVNFKNKKYSEKIGLYPEVPLHIFKQAADQFRNKVTSTTTRFTQIIFAEYYIRKYAPRIRSRLKSYKDNNSRYKTYLHHTLGPRPLHDISAAEIIELIEAIAKEKSPATCNRILSLISSVMGQAYDEGLIPENPCKKVRSFKEDNIVDRIMTDGEVDAFIRACKANDSSTQVLALYLALLTGIRIGNICSLKKSFIDYPSESLTLPDTKSGKPLTLPLSPDALEVISKASDLAGDSEYIFASSRSKNGYIAYPDTASFKLCQQAGIATRMHPVSRHDFPSEPLTIHCLRKTICSRILHQTGNLLLCRDLMGHADVKTTQRYAFSDDQQLRSAIRKVF